MVSTPVASSRIPNLIARHKAPSPSAPVESGRPRASPIPANVASPGTDKVSVFGFMNVSNSSGNKRLTSPAVTSPLASTPSPVSTPGGIRSARYRPMSAAGGDPMNPVSTPVSERRIDSPDSGSTSTSVSGSTTSSSSAAVGLLRKNRSSTGSGVGHHGGKLTYSVQGTGKSILFLFSRNCLHANFWPFCNGISIPKKKKKK